MNKKISSNNCLIKNFALLSFFLILAGCASDTPVSSLSNYGKSGATSISLYGQTDEFICDKAIGLDKKWTD